MSFGHLKAFIFFAVNVSAAFLLTQPISLNAISLDNAAQLAREEALRQATPSIQGALFLSRSYTSALNDGLSEIYESYGKLGEQTLDFVDSASSVYLGFADVLSAGVREVSYTHEILGEEVASIFDFQISKVLLSQQDGEINILGLKKEGNGKVAKEGLRLFDSYVGSLNDGVRELSLAQENLGYEIAEGIYQIKALPGLFVSFFDARASELTSAYKKTDTSVKTKLIRKLEAEKNVAAVSVSEAESVASILQAKAFLAYGHTINFIGEILFDGILGVLDTHKALGKAIADTFYPAEMLVSVHTSYLGGGLVLSEDVKMTEGIPGKVAYESAGGTNDPKDNERVERIVYIPEDYSTKGDLLSLRTYIDRAIENLNTNLLSRLDSIAENVSGPVTNVYQDRTTTVDIDNISGATITGPLYDTNESAGTDGYVLQTTGTGVEWVATSTLGISGGGVSVWGDLTGTLSDQADLQGELDDRLTLSSWYATTTDALTEGSTNLFSQWAGSGSDIYFNTGKVGIGESTPDAPLHVYTTENPGTQRTLLRLESADSQAGTGYNIDFAQGGVVAQRIAGVYEDAGVVGLAFSTYGGGLSEKLRITGTGNIGIGTTSPYAKLSIVGTGSASTPALSVEPNSGKSQLSVSAPTDTNYGIKIFGAESNTTGTKILSIYTAGGVTPGLTISSASGWNQLSMSLAGDFYASQIISSYDTNSGFIGNSAGAKTGSDGVVAWTSGRNYLSPDTSLSRISAGVVGVGTGAAGSVAGTIQAATLKLSSGANFFDMTSYSTYAVLRINALDTESTTFGTDGWHILSNDVIGFANGSSNPITNTLDVALSRISAGVMGVGTGAAGSTAGTLIANTIGVGTSNPLGPLGVSHTGSNTAAIVVGDQTTSSNNTGIYLRTTSLGTLTTASGGQLHLGTAGSGVTTNGIRIDSSGNVGIGTTSPYAKLSITNEGTGPSFVVEDSPSPDSTPFIVDESGNVGIGISSPAGLLDVGGSSRFLVQSGSSPTGGARLIVGSGAISVSNSGKNGYGLSSVAGNFGTFQNDASNTWSLGYTTNMSNLGTPVLSWGTGGRVGIGTTSPFAKFSVHAKNGETNTTLFAIASSTASATTSLFSVSNTGVFNFNTGNNQLVIDTTTTYEPVIKTSGSTGLKIQTPGGNSGLYIAGAMNENTPYMGIGENGFIFYPGGDRYIKFRNATGWDMAMPDLNIVGANQWSGSTSNLAGGDINITGGSGASASVGAAIGGNVLISGGTGYGSGRYGYVLLNPTSGNVGIGTTSPYAKLSIHANNGGTNTTLFNVASSTASATTSLFSIKNTGYVGIGTDSPASLLQLYGLSPEVRLKHSTNNEEILLHAENDNPYLGFTGVTGYVKVSTSNTSVSFKNRELVLGLAGVHNSANRYDGVISVANANSSLSDVAGSNIFFKAGVASGNASSGAYVFYGALPVASGANAQTQIEIARLEGHTGNLGLATSSPWRKLSVTGTVGFDGLSTAAGSPSALCLSSNKEVVVNTGTATCTVSSARFKEDIIYEGVSGLDVVLALKPATFRYKDSELERVGFIAEDVNLVESKLTFTESDGVTLRGVRYEDMTAVLAKAIQELNAKFEDMKTSFLAGVTEFKEIIVSKITSEESHTDKLCIEDVCITRDDLAAILESSNVNVEPQTQSEEPAGETNTNSEPSTSTEPVAEEVAPTETSSSNEVVPPENPASTEETEQPAVEESEVVAETETPASDAPVQEGDAVSETPEPALSE